jgi:hypothetical protein
MKWVLKVLKHSLRHTTFTWFYDVFVLRCFLCGSEVEQIWMDDSKKIFFFDSCKKTSVSVSTLSVFYWRIIFLTQLSQFTNNQYVLCE